MTPVVLQLTPGIENSIYAFSRVDAQTTFEKTCGAGVRHHFNLSVALNCKRGIPSRFQSMKYVDSGHCVSRSRIQAEVQG